MRQANMGQAPLANHPHEPTWLASVRESRSTSTRPHYRAPRTVTVTRPYSRSIPLSRELPCPVCAPHERHLLPCDVDACTCHDIPIPGLL